MFNSPSTRATPRKAASRASVARSRHQTPSIFAESASLSQAPTPSVRSSRLGIVKRGGSPTSSAGDTVRTTRVDESQDNSRVFWSRDERHLVSSLGLLPKEVAALVRNSDLVAHPIAGHVDPKSGFAMVTSPSMCIAWNYTRRTHSAPTTYTFPSPPVSYSLTPTQAPTLAALYTGSASSEPGMILVSTSGEIRFWDSMSVALANVDRFQEIYVELGEADAVEKLWKIDAQNFLLTTSSSLAFRLTVSSQGGRLIPTLTQLTRPGGMFGRASPQLFNAREDRDGISSVASAGGDLYIMARRMLQKWAFGADGHRYVQEYDLHEAVGSWCFDSWSIGNVSLELNDIVCTGQGELAVLISYVEQQSGTSEYPRLHNSHAIVLFSTQSRTQSLVISRVVDTSYLAHSDPRMLDVPRLLVPPGSSMAFIRFAEVVLMVSLDEGSPYEEAITLKDTGPNAFIGAGPIVATSSKKGTNLPSIVAIPAFGGLMSIEALEKSGSSDSPTQTSSATARLKSKMEQAVFFGERSDNPLSFDLPAGFQGDLAEAAEIVSAEIVSSSSPYMPGIFEIRSHLSDRLLRLKELMNFIRHNGLLTMLPQSTRRKLSRDAEKIKGAIELWDYQNRQMDQIHTRSPQSLLSDSIYSYMHQADIVEEEDFIRLFFRAQVQNLDKVLETAFETARAALDSVTRNEVSSWVVEANRIFIIVERAAAQYREEELYTYEIDREKPAIEMWTAQDSLLDALDSLYTTTEKLIEERSRDLGSAIDEPPSDTAEPGLKKEQQLQSRLKGQMAILAAALCTNMEDKCRATSRREIDEGADPQEGVQLRERWAEMKPRVIRPLVAIDRLSEAYELAENHTDYSTLVALCHTQTGPDTARLQRYIERFGEEFAFVLYQWYIDQGQAYELLNQDEVYGALVTRFFAEHHYPELAWMHHLAFQRYDEAAHALKDVMVDDSTTKLGQQHLIGSIAKLAAVADVRSKGVNEDRKRLLIELDDELDLVNVQSSLIEYLSPRQRHRTTKLDDQITLLSNRPAFQKLFTNFAQQLTDGLTLDLEGLIDILTLKDNFERAGDAALALERLVGDTSLPEGRKQVALLSVWRRVYIRDDWAAIANTTGRSEQAQRSKVRSTSAYQTIKLVNDIKDFPRNFILSPFTSSQPPLPAELAARFPTFSAEDISALMADHETEIEILNRYLTENGLEERIREVAELVKCDIEDEKREEGDVDIVM
ncbi:uncharacterized protein I303_100891 [Kwoniella dejecticola CBS 10117]|uniref:Nuclear pore complex protein Nup133 n=1 Tax=Kwoniella dejecticola CBS 10117 TaxID=1296121 RepID=A0A1A6AGB8_9TREE|nr:uncharacterized protein I303_00895 [Kwoniella dejecticola CBS 10117]OBR89073.1 hypothetical protein I303_00895 [Kwoniella dejecticola CBS 10117]